MRAPGLFADTWGDAGGRVNNQAAMLDEMVEEQGVVGRSATRAGAGCWWRIGDGAVAGRLQA
jgi:hypothetical protein